MIGIMSFFAAATKTGVFVRSCSCISRFSPPLPAAYLLQAPCPSSPSSSKIFARFWLAVEETVEPLQMKSHLLPVAPVYLVAGVCR